MVTLTFILLLISTFAAFPQTKSENKPDKKVSQQVQEKIRSNLFYNVFDWVTVESKNGNVTLNGYVHLPWDKKFFVKIAKEVDGVKSVNDKLVKVSGPNDLMYKAAEAIYGSPDFEKYSFMKDPPIHIIVMGDRILLEGSVPSRVDRDMADMLIEGNTDAFRVDNNLLVD
jgi:hypothetical protein